MIFYYSNNINFDVCNKLKMPNTILKLEDELYLDNYDFKYIKFGYKLYELVPFDKKHQNWGEGTVLTIYNNSSYILICIKASIEKRKVFDSLLDALIYLERKNKLNYLLPTIDNINDAIRYYGDKFKDNKIVLIGI